MNIIKNICKDERVAVEATITKVEVLEKETESSPEDLKKPFSTTQESVWQNVILMAKRKGQKSGILRQRDEDEKG